MDPNKPLRGNYEVMGGDEPISAKLPNSLLTKYYTSLRVHVQKHLQTLAMRQSSTPKNRTVAVWREDTIEEVNEFKKRLQEKVSRWYELPPRIPTPRPEEAPKEGEKGDPKPTEEPIAESAPISVRV